MAHRLPRARLLSDANVASVTEGPAAYVLYGSRGTVIYVGFARSLRARLTKHVVRGDIPAISFGVLPTDTVSDARRLERELILEHEPTFNLRAA